MDNMSRATRSKVMSSIKGKNTNPELALRLALFRKGMRYKIHYSKKHIDIAFVGCKVAIFVDGCFWHVCPRHGSIPQTNQIYWIKKFEKNIANAERTNNLLYMDGWLVFRFWEHDLHYLAEIVELIFTAVNNRKLNRSTEYK